MFFFYSISVSLKSVNHRGSILRTIMMLACDPLWVAWSGCVAESNFTGETVGLFGRNRNSQCRHHIHLQHLTDVGNLPESNWSQLERWMKITFQIPSIRTWSQFALCTKEGNFDFPVLRRIGVKRCNSEYRIAFICFYLFLCFQNWKFHHRVSCSVCVIHKGYAECYKCELPVVIWSNSSWQAV